VYTIKQAARLTGVSEASLRAWERRYGVVVPMRNASGYRVYDQAALTAISAMRRLVEDGWSASAAAAAVRSDDTPPVPDVPAGDEGVTGVDHPVAATHLERFVLSAARMDTVGIEQSLDEGFSLGSFEHVVDAWLFPALTALGEG